MRVSLLIIFVSVVLMQALQGFITFVDFKVNQKEIIQKYCINKDRPKLKCDGNCYLAKQLKKQDELFEQKKKENEKNHVKKLKEVEFFAEVELFNIPNFDKFNFIKPIFSYQSSFSERELIRCFHPPQV